MTSPPPPNQGAGLCWGGGMPVSPGTPTLQAGAWLKTQLVPRLWRSGLRLGIAPPPRPGLRSQSRASSGQGHLGHAVHPSGSVLSATHTWH